MTPRTFHPAGGGPASLMGSMVAAWAQTLTDRCMRGCLDPLAICLLVSMPVGPQRSSSGTPQRLPPPMNTPPPLSPPHLTLHQLQAPCKITQRAAGGLMGSSAPSQTQQAMLPAALQLLPSAEACKRLCSLQLVRRLLVQLLRQLLRLRWLVLCLPPLPGQPHPSTTPLRHCPPQISLPKGTTGCRLSSSRVHPALTL